MKKKHWWVSRKKRGVQEKEKSRQGGPVFSRRRDIWQGKFAWFFTASEWQKRAKRFRAGKDDSGRKRSQVLKNGRQSRFSSSQSRQAKKVRKFAIRQFPDKKASAIFAFFSHFFKVLKFSRRLLKTSSVLSLFTLRERLLCRQGSLKFCAFVLYFNTAILVPKFPFFRLYFNVLKFSPQRTGVALPNQLT